LIPRDEIWQAIYLLVASNNQTLPWHFSSHQSVRCKYPAEIKFLFNKKFWEELIANFSLIRHGRTENGTSKDSSIQKAVFLDVTPCGFIINRRFGGTCRLHLQGRRNNASEEECNFFYPEDGGDTFLRNVGL
jgi:hypothetical protein